MKARLRREEEEAEVARQIRQEKFALELEKKKLDLAETKHVQTKLPDLQISKATFPLLRFQMSPFSYRSVFG